MRHSSAPAALRRLLAGTDFSPGAAAALSRLPHLPLAPRAEITILHTLPAQLSSALRAREVAEAERRLRGEAARLVRGLRAAGKKEVRVRTTLAQGHAPQEITAPLGPHGPGRGGPPWDAALPGPPGRVDSPTRPPVRGCRDPAGGAAGAVGVPAAAGGGGSLRDLARHARSRRPGGRPDPADARRRPRLRDGSRGHGCSRGEEGPPAPPTSANAGTRPGRR